MALFQAQLGTSDTSVFNPSANSAVTTMFICNTHTSAITVTIHLINGSGIPNDTNAILKDLSIPAKDTYTMNNERITVAENYMDDRGDSDLEKQIATLKARVKDLEDINKKHQELNGQLRKELESVRKTSTRVS